MKYVFVFMLLIFISCNDNSNTPSNKDYDYVEICNQKWMAQNLDVTHYRNGDPIKHFENVSAWASAVEGAWCYYNNDSEKGDIYGKLYNWYAVNDPRGLAPEGWRVANDEDWNNLDTCILFDARKIMESSGVYWGSQLPGTNNTTGMTVLPSGTRMDDGVFSGINYTAYFWSLSKSNEPGICRIIYSNQKKIQRYYKLKYTGMAVRCIKEN